MNVPQALTLLALSLPLPSLAAAEVTPISPENAAAVSAALNAPLHEDENLVCGSLPNGLHYMIRPTKEPAGRASLRLYVKNGSLNETSEVSGVSHFIEHLVFNGSRHYKRGELIPVMQRMGLGFGGDANAYTGLLQTVFMLDLPNLKGETVDTALTILRDFADGATISDDAVEHERGIVISELKARDSEAYRSSIKGLGQLTEGSRIAEFMPIGKEEVIRNVSPEAVRNYYHSNYLPSRMTVMVTGDVKPADAKAWVEKYFGDMEAKDDPQNLNIGKLCNTGSSCLMVQNPESALCTMSVAVADPWQLKPDSLEQRVEDLPMQLACAMLNIRFANLAKKADCPFLSAAAGEDDVLRCSHIAALKVTSEPEKWQEALSRAEQELRKACVYGFQDSELKEAVAAMIRTAQRSVESWDTVSASAVAKGLVASLDDDELFTSPQEDLRALVTGLTRIGQNPDLCRAALQKAYDMSRAKLSMSGHLPEGVDEAAFRQAFEQSCKQEVQKDAEKAELSFAYDKIGEPGKVVHRQDYEDLGVSCLVLSNGVRVNLKPVDFKKGSISVSVDVDGGSLRMKDKPGLAMLADSVMSLGGLEAHTTEDLQRLLAGHNVSLGFGSGLRYFNFNGSTDATDLELQCKLLAAAILHPGFRSDGERLLRRNLPAIFNKLETTSSGAFAMQAPRFVYGNDSRFCFPEKKQIESYSVEDVKKALLPYLQKGAIELTLVGDFKVEDVLPILERSFGAMPQRNTEFTPMTEEDRKVNMAEWGQRHFIEYKTDLDKTIVTQLRPMGNGMDRHRNRRLSVLTAIVRSKLFDGIRAELGETYSPSVSVDVNNEFADAAYLNTSSAGVLDNRVKVNSAMDLILTQIGKGEITQDDFDCAIRPIIATAEKALRDTGYWAGAISHLQTEEQALDLLRDRLTDLKSISYEEIRDLAKEVLGGSKASYFFTVPEGKAEPSPEGPKPEGDKPEAKEESPAAPVLQPAAPADSSAAALADAAATPAIAAGAAPAASGEELHYVVLMTEATAALPEWKAVAQTLASKYKGAGVCVLPELTEENCAQALRAHSARYAAYVLRPEETGREEVLMMHRAARRVDDDPWGDCLWGIVSGYDAESAMRIAESREPLVIKRVLGTTNMGAERFEYSYCLTDWSGFPVLSQRGYQKPVTTNFVKGTPEGDAAYKHGLQDLFAAQLAMEHPQFILSSSHATQFNLEMPFSKGLIFPAHNRFYCLPVPEMGRFGTALGQAMSGNTQGMTDLADNLHLPAIEPDHCPRVWLAAGNCLFGDAAHSRQSMAVTAISAYSCNQLVGYTVPSWYGEAGWGTLSCFSENCAGTSLAEAFFLNNQFLLEKTMRIDPTLLKVNFNDEGITARFQREVLRSGAKLTAENAKDAFGLVHDRDVLAFFGDPAWRASLDESHSASPFSVSWQGPKEFVIRANRDVKGRCAVWFPTAESGKDASGCDAEDAVFTNDFILFPQLEMKAGESKSIHIR